MGEKRLSLSSIRSGARERESEGKRERAKWRRKGEGEGEEERLLQRCLERYILHVIYFARDGREIHCERERESEKRCVCERER